MRGIVIGGKRGGWLAYYFKRGWCCEMCCHRGRGGWLGVLLHGTVF